MTPAPTLFPPALAQSRADRRLQHMDRFALLSLWQDLSPAEYRPMKAESLALTLGIKRQNAARILRRLVACGYVVSYQPTPRDQRLYLLVGYVPAALAA